MKYKILFSSFAVLLIAGHALADSKKEARVTQIIRDVKILPADAAARAAVVNDRVADNTGVRTGGESRSELTFADLTITRLGSNTIFSFNKAGRNTQVDSGSILLRVPKDSGGGRIKTSAVTVAVTGTTVIVESARGGRNKLIVLEGGARISLVKYPKQFQNVRGSQMVDVPAGATTVPPPVNVDLNDIMRRHPLITDFPPLPSRDLIVAASQQPPPPRGPSVSTILPIIDLFGGGIRVGPRGPRGPRNPPGNQPQPPTGPSDPKNPPGSHPHPPGPREPTTGPQGPVVVGPTKPPSTPPPVIYRQTPGQTRVPGTTNTQNTPKPKPRPTPIKKKPSQPSGPR